MKHNKGFASDNNAGVHPTILKALETANQGHTIAYGDDEYTKKAIDNFKKLFGEAIEVYFVFNGTGANVLGLTAFTRSYNSIICSDSAHINVDECGAPEKFSGCKVIAIPSVNGKLTPDGIKQHLHGFGFEHHSQPAIISITQSTELGTVYTPSEISAIAQLAHDHNMFLHMDGARIGNASVSLNADFKSFTKDAGVDVLSFGGTKNGLMYGEAIVFFNTSLAENFKFIRKQGMQLASKMRYISAQFNAYLSNDLWRKNALHANNMAARLYEKLKNIQGIKITRPVESNGVFAIIPKHIIAPLQEEYFFYVWDESTSEVRWMTSFDTTNEEIDDFAKLLEKLLLQSS